MFSTSPYGKYKVRKKALVGYAQSFSRAWLTDIPVCIFIVKVIEY